MTTSRSEEGWGTLSAFSLPSERPSGSLRDVYAQKGLSQIPRLLSLQDRNPLSRTYGCFNREYWLCRTVDFPSSIAQFGVHSLALAYTTPFPDNPYYRAPKVRQWALAGIDYWMKIQKSDGSFDEFYPNERGWAGPTGFLLYVMCDSYWLLGEEFPASLRPRFLEAVARAGHFLAKYDEPGVLANHHAMAVLPIYEAYHLLQDQKLLPGFKVRLDDFLAQAREEGWCLEYDGADLGYLSATVSFLSKLHKRYQDERTEQVCQRAIEFASYFAYPNGHYAGSMGSRQTLHFYPHGFEVYAGKGHPLAAAVAERLLRGLARGALVPPEIQEDRYFLYRIPELLQSWIDYGGRPDPLPPLPDEREPFEHYWPGARIFARKGRDAGGRDSYTLINLAKGGVIKHFRLDTGASVENDCGLLAQLSDGKVVTSQWISETNRSFGPSGAAANRATVASGGGSSTSSVFVPSAHEGSTSRTGRSTASTIGESAASMTSESAASMTSESAASMTSGSVVPMTSEVDSSQYSTVAVETAAHYMVMKLFNPVTMIGFRIFMLAVGWQTRLAYEIKGWIRRLLMTRSGATSVRWRREVEFQESGFVIRDRIERGSAPEFVRVMLGDEFHVRYVPQSRYFQLQELGMVGVELANDELARLNRTGHITLERQIDYHEGLSSRKVTE